ncbi:MAG: RNA polymerase sigma factor [Caldilineaceae bacterium]|nr:RNA polymerase sigma factor [Caldilineaceae bacterium]
MTDDFNQIIEQAKAGDPAAWATLTQRFQTPAVRAAYTILGNRDEADDAVQDGWLLALHKLDDLREPARFGGWFYRIVANVALRRRQQRTAWGANLELLEKAVQPDAEATDAAAQLDRLPLALQALSARDQIVVSLHYFSGAPVATIAHVLGIPLGTVKSRLHHARQTLRKEFEKMNTQGIARPDHIPADFRQTIAGTGGEIPWQPIFNGAFVGWLANRQSVPTGVTPTGWERVGSDGLVGEDYANGLLLTYGELEWQDLELSLLVTPLAGGNAQILLRCNEQANGWYLVDLLIGWQAIAISRLTFDAQGQSSQVKLSVVDYPLEHGHGYALSIATRGHSITTYMDGALVNQLTDATWLGGRVGLNVWKGKTLFRDMKLRLLR